MVGHAAFADVELMLVGDGTDPGLLEPFGTCVTSTPIDLKAQLAGGNFVIRVARVGGGESANRTTDNPRVSVQVFALRSAAAPRAAHDRAGDIRAFLINAGVGNAFGRLDKGETDAGPAEFPWPDPDITVVQQIFRLSTRR